MARIIVLAGAVLLMIAVVTAAVISRSSKDEVAISNHPPSSAPGQKRIGNSAIGHGGPSPVENFAPSEHGLQNKDVRPVSPETYP